jgi:hypothetical protein
MKHTPVPRPSRRPVGLTDQQLDHLLAHARLVALPWRRMFFVTTLDYLARISRGQDVTNEQVQAACAYALVGHEAAASSAMPCAFDAASEPGPVPNAHTRQGDDAHA